MPFNLFFFLARICLRPVSAAVPAATRFGAVVASLWLVACAQGPQAAMAPVRSDALASTALAHPAQVTGVKRCHEAGAARDALMHISQELRAHGMALQATCHAASGGWVVQVRVTDGVKASKVVRGPLADGHEVDMGDMGTPAVMGSAGAPTGNDGVSPDVKHNRQWLSSLMRRHQFEHLPDAGGWHFAQQGATPAPASETDLAAR